MNIKKEYPHIIAFFVEKTMKGVRKQLRGYVFQVKEDIGYLVRREKTISNNFEETYKKFTELFAPRSINDFYYELRKQNEVWATIKDTHEKNSNFSMDISFLQKDLQKQIDKIFSEINSLKKLARKEKHD